MAFIAEPFAGSQVALSQAVVGPDTAPISQVGRGHPGIPFCSIWAEGGAGLAGVQAWVGSLGCSPLLFVHLHFSSLTLHTLLPVICRVFYF